MNKELKKKWVEALRSGDYKQTKGYLQVTDPGLCIYPVGFCCLGVLCEVANYPYMRNSDQFLPSGLQEEQGLGMLVRYDSCETIASHVMKMNDVGNNSFSDIADWIEANVPEDEEVTAQD